MRDRGNCAIVISTTFHHVGVVTRDLAASTALYLGLGYEASVRYDDPLQNVSIVLMRRPDSPMIELILPTDPASPAMGWLKRVKAGPYHTCYEVAELAAGIRLFEGSGFSVLNEPLPAVAFGMRQIVFLWSNEAGLIELLES
jgi:methylmalonyl-CoA/ethylmalonyl-CoA epimerase